MKSSRYRIWCFTINNHTELEWENLHKLTGILVCQEETGENGTPHIQGVIKFKNARTMSAAKKLIGERAHLEVCNNWRASIEYCGKEETRTGRHTNTVGTDYRYQLMGPLEEWKWNLLNLLRSTPDKRTIHWFVDYIGGQGKTQLAKMICEANDYACYLSGKSADMKYAICEMQEDPKIILMDIPRCNEGYVSYSGIEEIKNGIFFSGKYEGRMKMFDSPHVVVLANFHPRVAELSADRWNIIELGGLDLENLTLP